jgi:hypothetical protein
MYLCQNPAETAHMADAKKMMLELFEKKDTNTTPTAKYFL